MTGSTLICSGQQSDSAARSTPKDKAWYERFSIRGYVQARYNRLLETNPQLRCDQCDRSWGENGGFFLRRVRIILFGQISSQVYFYIQPDFASSASSSSLHFAQIRDAYFDVGFDSDNEYRLRIGQSKIPYGFENMQSSQKRLPLDRNDALNSGVLNERDLGVMAYWAPKQIRRLFSSLVNDGLKGSGDYGVAAFGLYNGQAANRPEANNGLHAVARLTYPFQIGNTIIEPSIQAYSGTYILDRDALSAGVKYLSSRAYPDERLAASFVLYPQPFGIQAEYTIGRGPEFNAATDSIETRSLTGGYATLSYQTTIFSNQIVIPFVRVQYYEGGKKFETDARSYKVNEVELGMEWQPVKEFELVVMYTISSRKFEDFRTQGNFQQGSLLRLQAQLNF